MATIKDVAKAAGVSIATVSYALNNSSEVGEDTRKRIVEIAKTLNYYPSGVARQLKREKQRCSAFSWKEQPAPITPTSFSEYRKG